MEHMIACTTKVRKPVRRVLGLNVHGFTEPELEELILRAAAKGDGFVATYATAYSLALTGRDDSFCRTLNSCDVCYPDGWGVSLASFLLGQGAMPKTTANRYFSRLFEKLSQEGMSIGLLGGGPGVAIKVAGRIRGRCHDARLWMCDGFSLGERDVFEELRQFRPNVVFVAMGQPKQELMALQLRAILPEAVIVCVGGLFDVIAGVLPTCPEFVRSVGMEWAFRLVTRPRQVWRRYLIGLPKLGAMVAAERVYLTAKCAQESALNIDHYGYERR